MPRALPAVQRSVGPPTLVGHVTYPGNQELPPQDYGYRALLVSQPHYRTPGGGWSGGGPFFQESASLEHRGKALEVDSWFYYGIEYGKTVSYGAGELTLDRIPAYGGPLKGGLVGHRIQDARSDLTNLQRANYAKGIVRTRPGESEMGLGQFLAELRDLPKVPGISFLRAIRGLDFRNVVPGIQRAAQSFLTATADEYLNYEFGWKPFVKDLRDFRSLCKTIDSSIAKLANENHRNLRRRTTLERTSTISHRPGSPISAPFPAWGCGGYGAFAGSSGHTTRVAVQQLRSRTWFVAGYRYDIPDTSSWLWKGKAAAVLYGVLPSPRLVWEITPWSWLVDWFGDLGDILAYFSPTAVDALVTRYAFTMRHTVDTLTCTAETQIDEADYPVKRWPAARANFKSTRVCETKQRGFGWAPFGSVFPSGSLTNRQAAILAALGISRVSTFRF